MKNNQFIKKMEIPTTIKIIDMIMGSGKTSYAIQRINEDTENNYIFITHF